MTMRIDTDSDFSTPPGEQPRSFDTSNDWNDAVEACAAYVETRYPEGVNDELAKQLRYLKRDSGKHEGELDG